MFEKLFSIAQNCKISRKNEDDCEFNSFKNISYILTIFLCINSKYL